MNKSICPYPWMHLSAATDGNVRLCCNVTTSDPRIKDNTGSCMHVSDIENIQDAFNVDMFKDIRRKMLKGEKIDICERCYNTEDNGGKSVRNYALEKFDIQEYVEQTDPLTGKIENVQIKSLDFSWSNYCNLKCKMCSPEATNQLREEFLYFGKDFRDINLDKWTFNSLFDTIEDISPNLEEILVTGGEPLLNKDFLQYIDYLIEKDYAKNIVLVFHTNLTIMPARFLQRFSKFKHTQIHISIDGTGDTYEYIRFPGKWNIVDRNIKKLVNYIKDTDNIGAEAHAVFQSYNLHNICDLIKYFNQYKDIKNFISFPYFIYAYDPWHAGPNNVPIQFKNEYIKQIKEYITDLDTDKDTHFFKSLESCLKMINRENSSNIEDFKAHVESRDEYRNQNAYNILPWLKDV